MKIEYVDDFKGLHCSVCKKIWKMKSRLLYLNKFLVNTSVWNAIMTGLKFILGIKLNK